jgi:hypothetical protein
MLRTFCLLAVSYCVAFLCSCNKDSNDNPPTTDSTASGEEYIPLSAGTYWVYKDSASNEFDTATVLNDKVTQNNISFTKVQLVSSTDTSYKYYAIQDHNYYINDELNGIAFTIRALIDTANVGASWVDNINVNVGSGNTVQAKGTGTIVEKLNTFTVQGQAFSDIIHTRYVLSVNMLGTNVNIATYDFYFAKGKGIIKIKANITATVLGGGNTTSTQDLVNYSVK